MGYFGDENDEVSGIGVERKWRHKGGKGPGAVPRLIDKMNLESGIHCNSCKRWSAALKDCGGCGAVSYCGKECQRGDWKLHKKICGRKVAAGVVGRHQEPSSRIFCAIPVPTMIPCDIRSKCDHMDEEDKRMGRGKAVFGRFVEADETGWEEQSVTLRVEKLCEHVENLGNSKFDFYFALKRVVEMRDPGKMVRDPKLSVRVVRRARECTELLSICNIVGLSDEEGNRAVSVVSHWRRVPN